MADSWKLTAFAPKPVVQAALLAQEEAPQWDPEVVLAGFEVAEDRPDDWRLDAYLPRKPTRTDHAAVAGLFAEGAPRLSTERLPEVDWTTHSQEGLGPINAGCFHVHGPDRPGSGERGVVDLIIPASQAFGTGHHATTAGCLIMLDAMKRRGGVVRNLADVGTGTGLLALASLRLWPRALATTSDIDPVCAGVVEGNAAANGVQLGAKPGELTMVIAAGMDHPLLQARGPYDLLVANILAGPLVTLAGDFARAVAPSGNLLLAGLLESQEREVRRAYTKAGFRLRARLVNGDWSILWLARRRAR